jgi:hypothetical protein
MNEHGLLLSQPRLRICLRNHDTLLPKGPKYALRTLNKQPHKHSAAPPQNMHVKLANIKAACPKLRQKALLTAQFLQ